MERIISERSERQQWLFEHPRQLEALLLALVALTTLVAVFAVESSRHSDARSELERKTVEISSAIERRATENIAYLSAAGKLFSAKQDISSEAFGQFVRDLASGNDERGAVGMGWARWVQPGDVAGFETTMRERQPEFTVRRSPGAGAHPLSVITYLEPRSPDNLRAIGYDMNSEQVRRTAMADAASSRQARISGKVRLVQDADHPERAGFLVFVPVHDDRGALRGFVYSPFRAGVFLDSAMAVFKRDPRLHISLFDDHVAADRLIAGEAQPSAPGRTVTRTMYVGGHRWVLSVWTDRDLGLSFNSIMTIIFGAAVAGLLVFISRLLASRATEDRRVIELLQSQAGIRASLTRELHHRVKNTLANVLSIVALTKRRYDNVPDFADSLTARIQALSATHDLLVQSEWRQAEVGQIVRSELAPFMSVDGTAGAVVVDGPDVILAPNEALSLGLALHELATNAAKYGALGTPEGTVRIDWAMAGPDCMELHWSEHGGPGVSSPARRGFGLDLIERVVSYELGAPAKVEFRPEGVACTLRVPVRLRADFAIRAKAEADQA